MFRILFACSGSAGRSQMAEAYLRVHGGARFEVHSAGLEPKGINPYTRQVLAEVGIDMAGQTSKDLRVYLGKMHFGYLITVCGNAEARCPIFPGVANRLCWPFDDPAAVEGPDTEKLAAFRAARDAIEARIVAWLGEEPR